MSIVGVKVEAVISFQLCFYAIVLVFVFEFLCICVGIWIFTFLS